MDVVIKRMWSIYDRPKDFPNTVVAKLFEVLIDGTIRSTPSFIVGPDLEMVRTQMIEMGLQCIPQRNQDQNLVEIWT